MQTESTVGSGPVTLTNTVTPTALDANYASNTVYYVTNVADANCIAEAQDITGSNHVWVNPRPQASLISVDGTICNGDSFYLTNRVTGIEPWIISWSDGVTVTNPTAYAIGVASPTSNHTYTVTSVTDGNGCSGTDLTGSVAVTVTNCAPLAIWLGTPPTNVLYVGAANADCNRRRRSIRRRPPTRPSCCKVACRILG